LNAEQIMLDWSAGHSSDALSHCCEEAVTRERGDVAGPKLCSYTGA
jgi:hypothetical protein